MTDREIGLEILAGIQEIKKYKAGEVALKTRVLRKPASAVEIRKRLQLSQKEQMRCLRENQKR